MSAVNGRVCGGIELFWLLFNWNSGVLEYLGLAFRLIPPKNLLHLPSTAGGQQAFFMVQQPLLAPDAAAESNQFAVAANHAVTGNNHGHRIFIIRVAPRLGRPSGGLWRAPHPSRRRFGQREFF